ncbi:P1 family peptidase [Rhodobacter sp. NTK016B]|uniref:P1 family peptidase n=1 Tax=Rhodobacter sp. NTK016B TaxID=2759676 RepID=UPI001A8EA393|nr:P1 family peptidase [Rhodobacter sp. NTK016B]MBN8293353.1 P1 family peptidase [Rhodobacter sp. NTK016B]
MTAQRPQDSSAYRPGARNLITDVPGLSVGNARDDAIKTGVTVLLGDAPMVAGVHVMGGAPGTRETDLLAPDKMVQAVDALVLSGGSAFGLAAAQGVMDALAAQGRGFAVGPARVPIVPGAILFDLINGGDKGWAENPYPRLGRGALAACGADFALGSEGAGTGALVAGLKGGLGSASQVLPSGITVGALVAVNALGSVTVGDGARFWAAPFEIGAEFGGLGIESAPAAMVPPPIKRLGEATTIAIVATDAVLTKPQATRLATSAHDGLARAIVPAHTPHDGDLVFAVSTGQRELPEGAALELGHATALTLSRAIARAIHAARPMPGDVLPTWRERFD